MTLEFRGKIVLPDLRLNERHCYTLAEWEGYLIEIIPMVFNDRVVMTPRDDRQTYDHGWCYDKGGAGLIAALAWDPTREDEPAGWKKRVAAKPRLAPRRDPEALVRCQHGEYFRCHVIDCERQKDGTS